MSLNENLVHPKNTVMEDIFSATLTPYRSLSQRGFIVLMVLFGGTCFLMGIFYIIIGAWPVLIFLGFDVLFIYLALKINYKSGKVHEEIILRADSLIIRRFSMHGACQEYQLNPFWTKLHIDRDDEQLATKIMVLHKNKDPLLLGHFLNPDDKTSFAQAFQKAFNKAKNA